jgi:hypothetical protein
MKSWCSFTSVRLFKTKELILIVSFLDVLLWLIYELFFIFNDVVMKSIVLFTVCKTSIGSQSPMVVGIKYSFPNRVADFIVEFIYFLIDVVWWKHRLIRESNCSFESEITVDANLIVLSY